MRHRLLGHRAEPALQSACPSADAQSSARPGGLQKAKAVGAKTQRERDYIDALAVFYTDYDKVPHGARVQAYLKAMEALAQSYPDDDEAQIFYAITLNVAASPNDKTYANQLKGAAILEPIFKRQPRHPGVAHYLIHLYDTPPLQKKGSTRPSDTPRSRRRRRTRSTCRRTSSRASATGTIRSPPTSPRRAPPRPARIRRAAARHGLPGLCLSAARRRTQGAGRRRRDEHGHGINPDVPPGRMRSPLSPARYAVERGDWKGAAELQVAAEQVRLCRCDDLFRPRARGGAQRQSRRPPRPTSPNWSSCARSCARRRMPIGPSRSTSSGRSRTPGCSMPRANMMTRSRP